MRYFSYFVMSAALLVGSTSFANSQQFEYFCKLEANKAKGGKCFVRGEICVEKGPHGERNRCREEARNEEDIEASISVRCTDGFELRDRDARTFLKHGDLVIKGRDNGDSAELTIEDVDRNDEDEFEATLETENSESRTYTGECRIREEHGGGHD